MVILPRGAKSYDSGVEQSGTTVSIYAIVKVLLFESRGDSNFWNFRENCSWRNRLQFSRSRFAPTTRWWAALCSLSQENKVSKPTSIPNSNCIILYKSETFLQLKIKLVISVLKTCRLLPSNVYEMFNGQKRKLY